MSNTGRRQPRSPTSKRFISREEALRRGIPIPESSQATTPSHSQQQSPAAEPTVPEPESSSAVVDPVHHLSDSDEEQEAIQTIQEHLFDETESETSNAALPAPTPIPLDPIMPAIGGLGLTGSGGSDEPNPLAGLSATDPSYNALEALQREINALKASAAGNKSKSSSAKAMKPTAFRGNETSDKADKWIKHVRRYLNSQNEDPVDEINIALSYMIEDAATFAERIEADNLAWSEWQDSSEAKDTKSDDEEDDDRSDGEPAHYMTWKDFEEEFRRCFIDTDPAETARFDIRDLKMSASDKCADHVNKFKIMARRTSYNDIALIDYFMDSLPPRLYQRLAELPDSIRPKTLKEWYSSAIDADRAYHHSRDRLKQQKPTSQPKKQDNNSTASTSHNRAQQTQSNNQQRNNGGRQGQNSNQRNNNANNNRSNDGKSCFNCGEVGHWANKCPKPKKKPNQNQNTTHNRAQTTGSNAQQLQTNNKASGSSSILDQFKNMNEDELDNHVRALQQLHSKKVFQKGQS